MTPYILVLEYLLILNESPTRCNSMQSDLLHCKVTLRVSGVTAPIIKSTKNCNRSLFRVQFLVLLMMGDLTLETCRVTLQ